MIKNREELESKDIEIDLSGEQGNAFYLLGLVNKLGKQLDFDKKKRQTIHNEMTSGDYKHLIEVFDENFGEYVTLYR